MRSIVLGLLLSGVTAVAAPKDLHVYLLIGQFNEADAGGVVDRCYLLNDKSDWVPAAKLGPAESFVKKMLEQNKDVSIGLVVAEAGDAKIEDWLGKSERYWSVRKRAKIAAQNGTLKGVLWFSGNAGTPENYLENLKSLISNLRADTGDSALPFVAVEVRDMPVINAQIAKLPATVHATGVASSGEGCAEQMIRLLAARGKVAKPPSDIKFIDPHVHAMSVNPDGLEAVIKWMDERNVERCIVSPLAHKGSRPQNEAENQAMLANFRKHKGRIDRMCIIEPQEVETVEQAVAILKKEIADGAIAFGEHYGVGLMFDDPKNLRLYEACEKVGLPVMFHIDQNKNMVEPGMQRVDNVLKMFPKCKVIAHAYWWRQLKDADRQLQEHPNLYADMSGAVVPNVLNRDRKFAREFLIRNQDKIMWATDEGWWSFGSKDKQMKQHYTFLEELDLPTEVRYKIYRGNAEKLFGFKPAGVNL